MDNNLNNNGKDNEQKPWETEQGEPVSEKKPWDAPVDTEDYTPPVYEKKETVKEPEEIKAPEEPETPYAEPEVLSQPETEKEPETVKESEIPEEPKAPDFNSQRYVPPYYNSASSNNKAPKKPKNSVPLVVLSVVCIACVLLMTAMFFVIRANDWKSPEAPSGDGQNVTDTPDASDKEANGNGQGDELQNGEDAPMTGDGDVDVDIEIEDTEGKKELDYGTVYEKCAPAAVGILCTKNLSYSSMFGQTTTYEQPYVGSGFIIDEDGYIATNAHVVEEMDTIKVYLADGTTLDATLIGYDDLSDIAVLKVESEEKLPVMEFGDSSVLKVGDIVTAIGTPADISLAGTFTHGIISAVDREVVLDENGVKKTMRLLQTDATINPGNSGGPLLNMHGQVIGINTLKLTDEFEGIGFAIPSIYAKNVVEAIIENGGNVDFDPENGYVSVDETPQMGIANSQEITQYMSSVYGVPVGVQILLLEQGCSLEKNGARVGDIITEMNGVKITNLTELREQRDKVKPREEATVKVYRNGEYYDITFKMGSNISTK